jgi:hypothetical protein
VAVSALCNIELQSHARVKFQRLHASNYISAWWWASLVQDHSWLANAA